MYRLVTDILPKSKWAVKCPNAMEAEFIVVHNTANDASAANEIRYMKSNDNAVSYHYAVDDEQVIQAVPENRNAWHAGDGAFGRGNRKGIGIEICYSKSGGDKFSAAEDNAARFIAQLLKDKGWGIDKVTAHRDYSGKYCPHRTLDLGWDRFLNKVKSYLNEEEAEMKEEVYNWTLACPEWSRPYVQKALDLGIIKGDENGNLGLTDTKIWCLVVTLRAAGVMK